MMKEIALISMNDRRRDTGRCGRNRRRKRPKIGFFIEDQRKTVSW
jgi:hypothetical protein